MGKMLIEDGGGGKLRSREGVYEWEEVVAICRGRGHHHSRRSYKVCMDGRRW